MSVSADNGLDIVSSLLAAIIGGAIVGAVEWYMHKRRRREDLEEKVSRFLLDLVLIQSDWNDILASLEDAEEELKSRPPGTALWQTLCRFNWKPSLPNLDINEQLAPLVRLKSRALMEDGGWIFANYATMASRIDSFNDTMDRFETYMKPHLYMKGGERYFRSVENDPAAEKLRADLVQLSEHIATEIPHHLERNVVCQKEVYRASERYFGSADFLRLPK